jgi:hypothetical protein
MFQLVMFLVVLNAGPTAPRIMPEPSFNSYQECADNIPDHIINLKKAFDVHEQPYVLALGCMKTGEKS